MFVLNCQPNALNLIYSIETFAATVNAQTESLHYMLAAVFAN